MRIAVITGASSGMGREFACRLAEQAGLDEIWVIARRLPLLETLRDQLPVPVRALALDVTDDACRRRYAELLAAENPEVAVLVNAAGFGRFGRYDEIPLADCLAMIDCNAAALVAITQLTLPYMPRGGQIYQVCSLSSFQPVPFLNVYAATKAFVSSYSRALNVELAGRGIRCMAVSPGWVGTEFFDHAVATNPHAVNYYNRVYTPQAVVKTALRDMKKGRDVSVHGLPVRAQVLAVKLLPHRLVMAVWMRQQKPKAARD